MKSKDISKFNLAWQVIRVQCRDFKTVGEKINYAEKFLQQNANKHNFERVLNWLEGLKRGYINRNEFAVEMCQVAIDELQKSKDAYFSESDTQASFSDYDTATLKKLYNDLQKRSLKWLGGGYIHSEQESFLDSLAHELQRRDIYVNHNKIIESRAAAKIMAAADKKSTFFF